jgi:hypothetical protein
VREGGAYPLGSRLRGHQFSALYPSNRHLWIVNNGCAEGESSVTSEDYSYWLNYKVPTGDGRALGSSHWISNVNGRE